jgi:hydrogenase-4 component B
MTPCSVKQILLFWVIAWPLSIALLTACLYGLRPPSVFAAAWNKWWFAALWVSAPLPAVAAFFTGDVRLDIGWFLLGAVWEISGLRRLILGFTALLWFTAGLYGHGYLSRPKAAENPATGDKAGPLLYYAAIWPLTLAGNLLLVIAEDIPGFFTGYAVMTFSAYVLVVHFGTRQARNGAAAYMIMAVIGEGLILTGLLWGAGSTQSLLLTDFRQGLAGSSSVAAISAILWLGFGIKAGLAGLHIWLPMAHPVAPTPASAILSGAMIKAGLVGWMFTLPLGLVSLPYLGNAAMSAGLAAAFGAALYGVAHRDPKVVLAYSSVSQMGMMTALVGVALAFPEVWVGAAPVLVLFAAHHGFNKGALFMGVGMTDVSARMPAGLLWIALVLPALSLAGMLGSGVTTKWAVKMILESDHARLSFLLGSAAAGTALLMIRTLFLQYRSWRRALASHPAVVRWTMEAGWILCGIIAASAPWWFYLPQGLRPLPPAVQWPGLIWPALAGSALAAGAWVALKFIPRLNRLADESGRLPAGDLWVAYVRMAQTIVGPAGKAASAFRIVFGEALRFRQSLMRHGADLTASFERAEGYLRIWAGALMIVLALVLLVIMMAGHA